MMVGASVACSAAPPPSAIATEPNSAVASERDRVESRSAEPSRATVPEGYLGGLRELDVDAPPSIVMDVLADPEAYRRTLPYVRSLAVTGRGPQGEALVTIVQGTAGVFGGYTAHLLRERADRVHIWLDGALPHDIAAADGFAEVSPREGGGSHLVWFLAFDVGAAMRFFFGAKIQRSAMTTPDRIRALAEERAKAAVPPQLRRCE